MGNEISYEQIETNLFRLKLACKEMERYSIKCEAAQRQEENKIKKAIQRGNMEIARIHAENAISQKNQAINYLRMAARIDTVVNRVKGVAMTRNVTKSMAGVIHDMEIAFKTMDINKISKVMDKFEKQFDDLGIQSDVMESSTAQTISTLMPQKEVDQLMKKVADEAGLEVNLNLPQEPTTSLTDNAAQSSLTNDDEDLLLKKLAKLRKTESNDTT